MTTVSPEPWTFAPTSLEPSAFPTWAIAVVVVGVVVIVAFLIAWVIVYRRNGTRRGDDNAMSEQPNDEGDNGKSDDEYITITGDRTSTDVYDQIKDGDVPTHPSRDTYLKPRDPNRNTYVQPADILPTRQGNEYVDG